MGAQDEMFHIGDVVESRATGQICRVKRFECDDTTDFWADNDTGPYKQKDFKLLHKKQHKSFWDDEG
jgi:hypothetical protein